MAAARTLTALAVVFSCTVGAQSPPATGPAISYVASIKPNHDVNPRGLFDSLPGGRLTGTAVTMSTLLRTAYRVQDREVVGAPAWFATKRYDIEARAESEPAPSGQVLLQALLRDRFGLKVHREKRELPTFSLILARNDGKTGPQLIRSSFDCAAYLAAPHAPEPGRAPRCGARISGRDLSARAISMTQLATYLAPLAKRFTVDKTALTGLFDVELSWTPDPSPSDRPAETSLDAPSLFTAVQEQLGLKLISDKGLVELLVVDQASEPSQN